MRLLAYRHRWAVTYDSLFCNEEHGIRALDFDKNNDCHLLAFRIF